MLLGLQRPEYLQRYGILLDAREIYLEERRRERFEEHTGSVS